MKKATTLISLVVLIIFTFSVAAVAAYEPVGFISVQEYGTKPDGTPKFSMSVPSGWSCDTNLQWQKLDTNQVASEKYAYFDGAIDQKNHGVIVAAFSDFSMPSYNTLGEANEYLQQQMKMKKIKNYEMLMIAGCPAARWIGNETLENVKKTYVHSLYICGRTSILDIKFSTRTGDKELQGTEFQKLVATIGSSDQPSNISFLKDLPSAPSFAEGKQTIEALVTATEKMLGTRLERGRPTVPDYRISMFNALWAFELSAGTDSGFYWSWRFQNESYNGAHIKKYSDVLDYVQNVFSNAGDCFGKLESCEYDFSNYNYEDNVSETLFNQKLFGDDADTSQIMDLLKQYPNNHSSVSLWYSRQDGTNCAVHIQIYPSEWSGNKMTMYHMRFSIQVSSY